MKHVLVNGYGMVHAVILQCPFKYTVPRGMKSYNDITHDFNVPYNPTGKMQVECFHYMSPKDKDNVESDAIDFAVVRDGIVENVIHWGGAEWCPPYGTLMIPLEQWMGCGDSYNESQDKFTMNEDRLGKSDEDKTVAELLADAQSSSLS